MATENRNKLAFLLTTALFLGSFLGFYFATKCKAGSTPLIEADKIISSNTTDKDELAKASDLAQSVLTVDPKNCKALMLAALAFQRRGLIGDAIKKYELLIPESETFSKFGYYNLGALYEVTGNEKGAEVQYRMSLARDNTIPTFWANLIKLHLKQKRIVEAKNELEGALKISPNAPELLTLKPLLGM